VFVLKGDEDLQRLFVGGLGLLEAALLLRNHAELVVVAGLLIAVVDFDEDRERLFVGGLGLGEPVLLLRAPAELVVGAGGLWRSLNSSFIASARL
jgi:hypothetical protein